MQSSLEIFKQNVKLELTKKGWTQAQLAEKSGLYTSQISRYLLGQKEPSMPIVDRVAAALEIDPWILIKPPGPEAAAVPSPTIKALTKVIEEQEERIRELESRTVPDDLLAILSDIAADEDKLRAAHDFLSALRSIPNSAYDEGKTG